jgi:hypothetical protein
MMTYSVRHWWGKQERDVPAKRFAEILAELKDADDEHPDVSLEHESAWGLSYGRSGVVTFENVESREGKPRHMRDITPKQVIALWKRLARGDLAWLEKQPWQPGYGNRTK